MKNSADSLEVFFRKISELREDQVYFSELMEKEHSVKGKGIKGAKDDDKGPTVRGSTDWKSPLILRRRSCWTRSEST